MKRLLLIWMVLLIWTGTAMAEELVFLEESAVANRFAANPRAVRDIGDPFVVTTSDGYQVFATGGPIGFFTWRSEDLTVFERSKALKKVSWASSDYWAPEVFRAGDRWVMLYTARWKETGSLRTGIAFSDSLEGPYEDPLGRPLIDYGYATIDATLTWDDDGTPYLIFVRDCSENFVDGRGESHIYGVRLREDLLGTVGDPVLLLRPEGEWETRSGDTRWNEGPAAIRHDGKTYLFYSVNGYWMKEYSVCVAAADHPLGPYSRQGNNPLLAPVEDETGVIVSGPGHNAFFRVGEEWFTAYHTHTYPLAPSGNRQLCVDRAGFHTDGTAFINGPTLAPQLRPLAETHLCNAAPLAETAGDETGLLTDGDACASPASAPWLWEGTEVTFRWSEGITADLLVLCPAPGESLAGQVTINGTRTAPFSLQPGGLPGQQLILPFAPLEITELKLSFPEKTRLGEVYVIGAD